MVSTKEWGMFPPWVILISTYQMAKLDIQSWPFTTSSNGMVTICWLGKKNISRFTKYFSNRFNSPKHNSV